MPDPQNKGTNEEAATDKTQNLSAAQGVAPDKEVLKKVMEEDPFAEAEKIAASFQKPKETEEPAPAAEGQPEAPEAPAVQDEAKDDKTENPFSKKKKARQKKAKGSVQEAKDVALAEGLVVETPEPPKAEPPAPEKKESLEIKTEEKPEPKAEEAAPEAAPEAAEKTPEPAPETAAPVAEEPPPEKADAPKIVLQPKASRAKAKSAKKLSFDGLAKADPPVKAAGKGSEKPSTPTGKGGISAQKLLLWFLGLGAFFVFLFYLIVFWGTVSGDASNPLFETLGIDGEGLQLLLLTMTNVIFGLISLVLLITTLTLLFRVSMAGSQAVNRKQMLTTTGIYFIFFLLGVALWVFLYWFITNLNAGPLIKTDQSLIETSPQNVIDLDAPTRVTFSISEKLKDIIPSENLRQINWDFNEDGVYDASGSRVFHRFLDKGPNNGIYNVKAFIRYYSDKKGEEEVYETQRQVIINNESVLAVLSASPEAGVYPLEVELSALGSRDPDGSIVWYEWDLDGDGTFEIRQEEPVTQKIFEAVGEYKVALRVTGSNTDDYDVMEKTITVRNPEGSLRAEINTEGVVEGYPPLKVNFDGSNSFIREGKILRYEWFVEGENEPFIGRKMEKVFRKSGEYEVRLIVENDLGEKHETTQKITVLPDRVPAELIIDTTPTLLKDQEVLRGIAPFEVTFNSEDSKVKDAFEWRWDFEDDGITDEFSVAAKHIFRKPGVYDVKLSIVDANEEVHEKIQRIIVERAGVRAKINATPNAGEVPLEIEFDGSGSSTDEGEIVDYIWEFPNTGPIHFGSKIAYEFKQIGNFPVKLTILTSTGKVAKTETIISSRAPNIKADFIYSPKIGSAPLTVTFNPTSSRGLVREYLWDFGDGSVQKQYRATPIEHEYTQAGEYTAKLKLVDENGIVSTAEYPVEVRPSKR